MTLVTLRRPQDGVMVLTADLLITASLRANFKTRNLTPKRSKHSADRAGRSYVYGMNQKLFNISPSLIVGASGQLTKILRVIEHLRVLIDGGQIAGEELMAMLNRKPIAAIGEISLEGIGLIDGAGYCFGWNDNQISTMPMVRACGSGAVAFARVRRDYTQELGVMGGTPNPLDLAIGQAFVETGLFLADEYFFGGPLKDQFGGFWQVACASGAELRLMGDVSFGFCQVEIKEDGSVHPEILPFAISSHYRNGLLVIQTVETEWQQKPGVPVIASENLFLISPVGSSVSKSSIERPNFKTERLIIIARIGHSKPATYRIMHYMRQDQNHGFMVLLEKDKILFGISDHEYQLMKSSIESKIRRASK